MVVGREGRWMVIGKSTGEGDGWLVPRRSVVRGDRGGVGRC